ncbi:MAG TPA: Gfo/Idh/MocA family oxidoreductase [Mariniphaga anaerophila]|uniref:Gfo/Idh/MocA family oxidoreductase n=1 Tax=Mariniphaga anaerophila TaxID=1484053 RepID=A0A831LS34_9BACT|nr:Gfo/Idh/MocA family oxidoreductase [Mariniphaga anaerophila]
MSERQIRTAIIGCGKVSHLHAAALQQGKNTELTAIYSRSIEKANEFASQYGILAFNDIEKMIAEADIESAIICTPHPFHGDVVVKAANAGAHCLVEKPLASSLQDCDLMIQACKVNNVKLGVVSQRRFYAPVQRVKKAIEEGKIGSPALGTINMLGWRDKAYYESDEWRGTWQMEGGGVLVNQAPHQLDIFQWLMGPIDEVYGVWRNLNHPYIEVEDTAVAIVKFKNGAVGNIIVSNSQKPGIYGKVHVHGTNGASVGVQTDGGAMFIAGMSSIAEPPVNDLWTVTGEENLLDGWKMEDSDFFNSVNAMEYYMKLQNEDFAEAIIQNRKPMVTGEEGRITVELFSAIYRSTRDNQPVKFPLKPESDRDDFDGRLAGK